MFFWLKPKFQELAVNEIRNLWIIIISNFVSCHVMSRNVTSRHAMSRYVMSCHMITRYTPVRWTFCQRLQRAPVRRSHLANTCRDSWRNSQDACWRCWWRTCTRDGEKLKNKRLILLIYGETTLYPVNQGNNKRI